MIAILLQLALFDGGTGGSPLPLRPLSIPAPSHTPSATAEVRWARQGPTFPVAAGIQVTARVRGQLEPPLTDPGRTSVRVEVVLPLLSKEGRVVLLPSGSQLVGRVHLLHGELVFIDFESLILPDGRSIVLPEELFRLGPGSLLSVQDGTPALLTVARPLHMEAFGRSR